jgi:N,N'-diacetyllegionaminate synthase
MKIAGVDTSKEVFLIAEVGNNHEGDFGLAKELIGLAKESGAHAVKFQTFKTEHYISPREEARFKRTKSFELTYQQFTDLADFAKKQGIVFFSTPFDLQSADFLDTISPIFKIASGDNNFYPLIERIANTGKPVIMSGGLADLTQLRYAKSLIELTWQKKNVSQELALLHCVTSYPVKPEHANLSAIVDLRENFDCTVGYSDHTLGIEACVLACALGARIIEKHFTISKNHSDFRDHKLSAEPAELKQLSERIKEAQVMIGERGRKVQSCEQEIKTSMRRSIVAARDLEKGSIVSLADITWARPADGLAPGEERLVLGRKLKETVVAGHPLQVALFE